MESVPPAVAGGCSQKCDVSQAYADPPATAGGTDKQNSLKLKTGAAWRPFLCVDGSEKYRESATGAFKQITIHDHSTLVADRGEQYRNPF
ncbi:MAG TPA: hypothetical protein VGJ37_05930, partial [Pyrinomonadaceae bacterium]